MLSLFSHMVSNRASRKGTSTWHLLPDAIANGGLLSIDRSPTSMSETIRLATRGSELARSQAATVRRALERRRFSVDVVDVETTGDRLDETLIQNLGKTGAFVRSLDQRVLAGDLDIAVHSMKDVPTEAPDGLVLAAVPDRAPRQDLLLTPAGQSLSELPSDAVVGTASLRRRAQLLRARPELTVEPLRGNVDTRLAKLLAPTLQAEHQRRREAADADDDNEDDDEYDQPPEEWVKSLSAIEQAALDREINIEYDAIVLAEAGLDRLDLLGAVPFQRLPVEDFVPAPAQGALAVTAADRSLVETLQSALDDPVTRVETTVERTILSALDAGCIAPLGISARIKGEYVAVRVQVLSRDGSDAIERTEELPIESHREAAQAFASELIDAGAADLIETAKTTAATETADASAVSALDEE